MGCVPRGILASANALLSFAYLPCVGWDSDRVSFPDVVSSKAFGSVAYNSWSLAHLELNYCAPSLRVIAVVLATVLTFVAVFPWFS